MPGGWYGSLLRTRSAEDEWVAMQDHLNLLKLVNADVFVENSIFWLSGENYRNEEQGRK